MDRGLLKAVQVYLVYRGKMLKMEKKCVMVISLYLSNDMAVASKLIW